MKNKEYTSFLDEDVTIPEEKSNKKSASVLSKQTKLIVILAAFIVVMIPVYLFFVVPNRETAEKKLRPQIEEWIRSHGRELLQISGIVVYLTSISELAAGRWMYVYNMQEDKPVFTAANTPKKE